MRAVLVLMLAVSIASWAGAATVDPAVAWEPMHPFIGTWKATRSGSEGTVKFKRAYTTAPSNHHLEITETDGGSRAAVRGMVSFDQERQLLVLREFGADGSTADLAFDTAASTAERVVFASPESEAVRARVTYERAGPKAFVERVERSSNGASFTLVSEIRFVRTDW